MVEFIDDDMSLLVSDNISNLKDVTGGDLKIGDTVVTTFGGVSTLRVVKIISFSRTKIYVERVVGNRASTTHSKFPSQVSKVIS